MQAWIPPQATLLFVTSVAAEAEALTRGIASAGWQKGDNAQVNVQTEMQGSNQQSIEQSNVQQRRSASAPDLWIPQEQHNGERVTCAAAVLAARVGTAAAAAKTAAALYTHPHRYGLVVSAGIAGGFVEHCPVGSLAIGTAALAADLGSEQADGSFLSVKQLGFGLDEIASDKELAEDLQRAATQARLASRTGPVATVNMATGTEARAQQLRARCPGVIAEAMEGFGAATAAHDAGVAFLELRAISNLVGTRDREAWRIKDALQTLEQGAYLLTKQWQQKYNWTGV